MWFLVPHSSSWCFVVSCIIMQMYYIQCIYHGITSVLLCVLFIFTNSEKCQFGGGTWWLPFTIEIVCIFHSGYFDYKAKYKVYWEYINWNLKRHKVVSVTWNSGRLLLYLVSRLLTLVSEWGKPNLWNFGIFKNSISSCLKVLYCF